MSTPTPFVPPYSMPGYANGVYPNGYGSYDPTLLSAINATDRNLTTEINLSSKDIVKDITQSSLGLRDAIERGNTINSNTTERTAGHTQTALERISAENRMTTLTADAASRQYASDSARDIMRAVDHTGYNNVATTERNGSQIGIAVERTAGNTLSAVERVAAENRMTTLTADAASRQFAADTARDVMRAVDHNGYNAVATTERNGSQLGIAVERTAGNTLSAVERVAAENRMTTVVADAASRQFNADIARDVIKAVDYNGANAVTSTERNSGQLSTAIERNGGNTLASIERNAGENRMTTVVADAASRQAANDLARDITLSVERNGTANSLATANSYSGVLQSVERNSGETRQLMGVFDSNTQTRLADVRRDITGQVTENAGRVLTSVEKNGSDIRNEVSNAAWESRTGVVTGFSNVALQQAKNYSELLLESQKALYENAKNTHHLEGVVSSQHAGLQLEAQKALYENTQMNGHLMNKVDNQFAGLQLEQQKSLYENTKNTGLLMGKVDNQYAGLQLEQQKALHENSKMTGILMNKVDCQYAATVLESQKAKSEIENQASLHYSNLLLEQQRVKEYLSSKGDNHFAMTQLELQKVKSELAQQASTHFSVGQLEQQKLGSAISSQLAEAKYEALKTQCTLAEKMAECCCEVKQKIDLVDRDRLRDALTAQTTDNNSLKQATELGFAPRAFMDPAFGYPAAGFGPGYGPAYGPGYGYNSGRNQNGPGNGNGDVNIYSYEGGHRRGRRSSRRCHSRSRSRSHSSDRGSHRG